MKTMSRSLWSCSPSHGGLSPCADCQQRTGPSLSATAGVPKRTEGWLSVVASRGLAGCHFPGKEARCLPSLGLGLLPLPNFIYGFIIDNGRYAQIQWAYETHTCSAGFHRGIPHQPALWSSSTHHTTSQPKGPIDWQSKGPAKEPQVMPQAQVQNTKPPAPRWAISNM